MSHHTESFAAIPTSFTFDKAEQTRLEGSVDLLLKGQGVFVFCREGEDEFRLVLASGTEEEIRLTVTQDNVLFHDMRTGRTERIGIPENREPACRHWLSLDPTDSMLRYGRGEVREKTTLAEFVPEREEGKSGPLASVESIRYSGSVVPLEILRDPVVVDPPLKVVPSSRITIEDVAKAQAIVPANLTPECRQLYENIAGENFRLDTPDFPDFVDAVERSIADPDGWCARKLREKASEFGQENFEETYLRITLGRSQGESPGIPYVIEIWPAGHYSPIHNHANTHAMIRVLSGEITVSLYPMLSRYYEEPFFIGKLRKDEVTWITPRFNQTHKLHNANRSGPVCITIQSYLYGRSDDVHYNYFDYLDDRGEVHQFLPNSDAEFLEFREILKREEAGRFSIDDLRMSNEG